MNAGTDERREAATVVVRLSAPADCARQILDSLAEVFDPAETALSTYESPGGLWTVAIDFLRPPNEAAVRALVALAAGPGAAKALAFERLAERDWVQAALDGLAPVDAGRFVVHGAHDRAHIRINCLAIEIEAALAFGTGHHATTRGCLLALDRLLKVRRPRRILDIGTGTGVLAIAAARALRTPVLASDIDPRAVTVARANARHNRTRTVTVVQASTLAARSYRTRAPFDLILANILLPPLQRMARPMAHLTAPGARLVLSGLLTSHANAALAAYRAQGFTLERRTFIEDWATLVLRRAR